jgi:release factor glutamine methyltransferase
MRLIPFPGVHRPVSDTWLLASAMRERGVKGASVADLCTGSGAIAIAAARAGASRVVAVDVSWRAVIATRLNAMLNGSQVQARHGDLGPALRGERFDVIVCNPPYVPAPTDALPRHRSTTPLDGGRDGRLVLDRVCRLAPEHLRPGGSVLLVHSSICDEQKTCALLREGGLRAEVVARTEGQLGPVMRSRAQMMRERGLLGDGDEEQLVVVRGDAAS